LTAVRNWVRSSRPALGIRSAGLVLAIAGYFGPWVPHETAALTVTGSELAEFAKLLPQVQGGTVPIIRVLFYSPLAAALILLALFAGRSTLRPVRGILPLALAALLPIAFLPYPLIESVRHALAARSALAFDPQYVGHLALTVVGMALTLSAPLAARLPQRVQSILVGCLALVGAAPALWQFVRLRPLVIALYGKPTGLGWGLIACVAGFGLLSLSALYPAPGPSDPHASDPVR
jgi:hypothetical protein